jgi:nucleotidyltransferase substrate binding protein (TIGR01987 family)
MEDDNRWDRRFANFNKALIKLSQAVEYISRNFIDKDEPIDDSDLGFVLDEMIKEGLIQRFEYIRELVLNVMNYAAYQGKAAVGGSRAATREAFQLHLTADGKICMHNIGSRNKTSHTCNKSIADEIYGKILSEYYPAFLEFQKNMEAKTSGEQKKLL